MSKIKSGVLDQYGAGPSNNSNLEQLASKGLTPLLIILLHHICTDIPVLFTQFLFTHIFVYLFAVESSLATVEDVVPRVVPAGSVVNFDCILNANCVNQSIRWDYYYAADTKLEIWYRNQRLKPEIQSSGVTVEEDSSSGRSLLTIPRVRFKDRGRIQCLVVDVHRCSINFHLIVTGSITQNLL